MATKNKKANTAVTPEETIENALNSTEQFLQKNSKTLLIALGVIVVVVAGFFGYKYLIVQPRMEKASEMMYVAEQYYAAENWDAALNGDGNSAGFVDVIDEYGSTAQGSLAAHYAGICYLKLGDMDSALEYLKKYDNTKGAPNVIINAQNYGLQGDILVNRKEYKAASELYEKAIAAADNILVTPYYLKKAALVYEQLGDNASALAAYRRIADEFGASLEARDVEKYIGQLEQK